MTRRTEAESKRLLRPDLVRASRGRLNWLERTNIRVIRSTFKPGILDRVLRFLQRTVGQGWIHHSTKNLRRVHGFDRLPDIYDDQSVLVVANHRSFFDLYVITAELVRRGMKKRIVFPVRSGFFYDSPFGIFVNFVMSFWAMYPPIFRRRRKAPMNLLALDELGWLLGRGGMFAGLHPEGTRKRDDDPYTFLPPQPGVGRVIQKAGVPVVPVFVNGLGNNLVKQVRGNFTGKGREVNVVFGAPIDFGPLLDEKPTSRVHRRISERCLEAISQLGEEEKALRACSLSSS